MPTHDSKKEGKGGRRKLSGLATAAESKIDLFISLESVSVCYPFCDGAVGKFIIRMESRRW